MDALHIGVQKRDPVHFRIACSEVRDFIPLGVSRRHGVKDTNSTHPGHLPREAVKKHERTLEPLKSLPEHMMPLKSPWQEQRSTSAKTSPSSLNNSSEGDKDRFSNNNVPLKKLQVYNVSNHSKEALLQPTSKKQHITHNASSNNRETALNIYKELNQNLKVGNSVLPTWSFSQHQKPAASTFRSAIQSPTSSAPLKAISSPGSRVEQCSQQSSEKNGDLLNGNHNPLPLSYASVRRKESTQPSTLASKFLPLKRERNASTGSNGESKRFCHEDVRRTTSLPSVNSTQGSSICSSAPKYDKTVSLKETTLPMLAQKQQCSPALAGKEKANTSSGLARQLFKEPSRESRTQSLKPHTATSIIPATNTHQPVKDIRTVNQMEEVDRADKNKRPLSSSPCLDHCPSVPSKLTKKHSDEGDSPVTSHPSCLPDSMHSLKISSPSCDSEPTSSSLSLKETPKADEQKSDPYTKPKDSAPSLPVIQDGKEKREPAYLDLVIDDEDMSLGPALSLSSTDSSSEEQLMSLKEILDRSARVYTTPEKDRFSEPSTSTVNTPEDIKHKPTTYKYKNTLEQMLKEKEQNQKTKELEIQMLQNCKEDLLKLDEEDGSENAEEILSREQREFLEKFSVTSCVIRDVHPGEELFTLANFGRLFDHKCLDLRNINVTPDNRAQQSLLQAHPEDVLLLLSAGLVRRAYCSYPCQPEVTHWFFKMMSVHPSPSTCAQILEALTTLALSAAQHIVERNNRKFQVWVPSLQDVAQVFLNMGVSFVSLFPHEALQPTFTEGDLLENVEIQPDRPKFADEPSLFPVHNFENIIKYLALCVALCPKAYTDEELLLLLTMVCRVSLETCLQLLPPAEITCLLEQLIRNMANWETQFPQICLTLADLSEDHHNLRRLVQLLPYNARGKRLRRHLSLSIISKLLNGRCTYIPECTEFQLSDLRRYLPQMRPSLLLKRFEVVEKAGLQEVEDSVTTPDQQAYYLCYSLLALMNEASTFEFPPSKQRNELQLLCSTLEKHIKCDIRENEKMLYRSKVKDLVARIYTKWQMILQRSRPAEGKLYDYWKPPEDEMPINQDSKSTQEALEEFQSEDSSSNESLEEGWREEEKLLDQDHCSEEEEEDEKEEEHSMLVDEEELPDGSPEKPTENSQDKVQRKTVEMMST